MGSFDPKILQVKTAAYQKSPTMRCNECDLVKPNVEFRELARELPSALDRVSPVEPKVDPSLVNPSPDEKKKRSLPSRKGRFLLTSPE